MKQLLKIRTLYAMAFMLPFAGIGISRLLPIGKGVATAEAAIASAEDEQITFRMPTIATNTIKTTADAAVEAVRTRPFSRSPVRAPVQVAAQPTDAVAPVASTPSGESKQKAALAELKAIEVSSILTGRQPLAVIGGKPRKVGDDIRSGWRIISIDPASGIIGVEHPDAGVEQLHLRKKSLEDSTAGSSGVRSSPHR